jgi:hypothetical protein
LYENTGNGQHIRGDGSGWEYNLVDVNDLSKDFRRDTLGHKISFLGYRNSAQFPSTTADNPYGDTNYSFYVDTAYVNRGTGWIKPQYMLVVDPLITGKGAIDSCKICGVTPPEFKPYVIGRYLYNTSMYAKKVVNASGALITPNYDIVQQINEMEWWNTGWSGKLYTADNGYKWERLAFSWAIHRGDQLIVLKTNYDTEWESYKNDPAVIKAMLIAAYPVTGVSYDINWTDLIATKGKNLVSTKVIPGFPGVKIAVHAVINLNDNKHKDWVFSFRYIERHADDFIIESETTDRSADGPMIRPGYSGWVKWANGVPTISRSDTKELMAEGELMNVKESTIAPVSNEQVSQAEAVKVIGGAGTVTILNATGKKVVISNILGQSVANTVLSSDNATLVVPTGIIVVAVEGENAVKAIVK